MKKKVFTLIEMLLVIVLIAILMLLMLRMGWKYVWNMQFRNDKESFVGFFDKAVSQAMSSNYYNSRRYNALSFIFTPNSSDISLYAGTGDEKSLINLTNLKVSKIGGTNGDARFEMDTYKVGCKYIDGAGQIDTGDVNFKLISNTGYYNYCFRVSLANCKLFEKQCDELNN